MGDSAIIAHLNPDAASMGSMGVLVRVSPLWLHPVFSIPVSNFLQIVLINRRRIVIFSAQHKDIPATGRHGVLETGRIPMGSDIGSECRENPLPDGWSLVGALAGVPATA